MEPSAAIKLLGWFALSFAVSCETTNLNVAIRRGSSALEAWDFRERSTNVARVADSCVGKQAQSWRRGVFALRGADPAKSPPHIRAQAADACTLNRLPTDLSLKQVAAPEVRFCVGWREVDPPLLTRTAKWRRPTIAVVGGRPGDVRVRRWRCTSGKFRYVAVKVRFTRGRSRSPPRQCGRVTETGHEDFATNCAPVGLPGRSPRSEAQQRSAGGGVHRSARRHRGPRCRGLRRAQAAGSNRTRYIVGHRLPTTRNSPPPE